MSKIIAISGFARSGKDTAFEIMRDYLELEEGWGFERVAFADALKSDLRPLVKEKFNINLYKCSSREKEIIRPLMVEYGRAHRSLDPEHWVKTAFKELPLSATKTIYVITDLRYENEKKEIQRICADKGLGFFHLHLEMDDVKPANKEELEFTSPLKESSDICLKWVSINNLDESQQKIAMVNYAEFFSKEVIR